jgi:hypothetical protein
MGTVPYTPFVPQAAIDGTIVTYYHTQKKYYQDRAAPLDTHEAEAILRMLDTIDIARATKFFEFIFKEPPLWVSAPGLSKEFLVNFKQRTTPEGPWLNIPLDIFKALADEFQDQEQFWLSF